MAKKSRRRWKISARSLPTERVEMVALGDLRGPSDLSEEECRQVAVWRVTDNRHNTKHPLHHKTVDGTIVTPDPTLEFLLSRLSEEQRQQFYEAYGPTPEEEAQAPNAIPVNRTYYGFDPFAEK